MSTTSRETPIPTQRIIVMVSRRAWGVISVASLVAALAIWSSSTLFIRAANPEINVRWRDSVDPAARAALERRFKLLRAEQEAANAWRYELTDTSRDMLGALVHDADVADTHFVDRTTFELTSDVPYGPRRPGPLGERWPRAALALVDRGPTLLVLLAAAAALFAAKPRTIPTPARVVRFLTRGIPALSARDLAVFRFVFGVALLLYIYLQLFPREAVPRELQRGDVQIGALAPLQWLAAHPQAVRAGQWTAIVSAALLALGIFPRLFFAVATAGTVQWLLALSLQSDSHQFGVFLLPLIGLLAAPWDAAPPLWRILRTDGLPERRNGYAPWFLSLALGVAWAGAAWAKLRDGPGWILNGTVRYHFVTDYRDAHVDWGLAIAAMPLVAIALSAGAVLIEALTITSAFTKPPMVRLAAGLAAMGVLTGFYLFQGIMWPAWWLLLLGFLPWRWQQGDAGTPGQPDAWTLSRAQLLLIVVILVQQFVVSTAFVEFPPLASRYDMYSTTHDSPEAFDRDNPGISRRIVAIDAGGVTADVTNCTTVERLMAYTASDPVPPAVPVKSCDTGNITPARYAILESQCLFDWKAGHPYCRYRDKVIATVPAK
jgi:hypothetical protein